MTEYAKLLDLLESYLLKHPDKLPTVTYDATRFAMAAALAKQEQDKARALDMEVALAFALRGDPESARLKLAEWQGKTALRWEEL